METKLTYAQPDPQGVEQLAAGLGCSPVMASLLYDRGIHTPEAADFFLNPTFEHLSDPFGLADMDRAVERIYTAVFNREKIMIFGDFDADGVTATALLLDFFTHVDAEVTWYIPHRTKEGYSLHPPHIEKAVNLAVDLIITVDCGITSLQAVAAASLEDIDVIITDHHEPGKILPPALAVINPKRSDCLSGLAYLAGVGVAFFLVMALRKSFRDKGVWNEREEPNLLKYLDLFAIGTIGDMVPLIHDNRVLCLAGLKRMQLGERPGIQSLARTCRMDLKQMDSDDIAFKIVPRINAAGRISHARICVSHLTASRLHEAETTASLLDELNTRRQQIEREIVRDIENRIQKTPSLLNHGLLMLWDPHWNPAVLGIVASRLSRKYVCPVVLLSAAPGLAQGSCRSINHINIHQALAENAHLLERFGGHAMAAGLALKPENLERLAQGLKTHFLERYAAADFLKTLTIDLELDIDQITLDLAQQIDRLRPFGTGNPEPVFLCRNLRVISSHIMGSLHRKMMLQGDANPLGPPLEAFHFNMGNPQTLPNYYNYLVFKLKLNRFKPNAIQIIIQDF